MTEDALNALEASSWDCFGAGNAGVSAPAPAAAAFGVCPDSGLAIADIACAGGAFAPAVAGFTPEVATGRAGAAAAGFG